jgi:AcrR family transcriptional regulator
MAVMTPRRDAAVAEPTRRQRQRQATYEEIVQVSRQLLQQEHALSLRGVADEMGLTPPALYRYVDGYDALLLLVARSIFADVVAHLEAARDRFPDDDPAAQLVAAAVAFRTWSLAHREEYGLVFTNPALSKGEHAVASETGADAFGRLYGEIYERVYDRYTFTVPTDDEMGSAVVAGLRRAATAGELPCEFAGRPIGLTWVFMRAWARLYGMVTLEVFGHLHPGLVASGAMFRAMLEDNGAELGFGEDWPRLRELLDEHVQA